MRLAWPCPRICCSGCRTRREADVAVPANLLLGVPHAACIRPQPGVRRIPGVGCKVYDGRSALRVNRRCVMSVGKNIAHDHSTKMRSLRPNVGIRDR